MNEDFERWRAHVDYVVSKSKRPEKRRVADALAECWEKLQQEGIEAYDFSHVAVMMASSAMCNFDRMEEIYQFGKELVVTGEDLMNECRPYLPPDKL